MTTRQRVTRKAETEEAVDTPGLRLAEHAIGLWQAAQDVGDPVVMEALRPLVVHIARSLARDVMNGVEDETAH
ncbi:hypothetical protein [Methylobacterium haplocladii]|uniref:Uncharacterized protein n=1 Tax=Methylobacterium haplocladii TaxID=1176176 RepID=A0A512IVV3_9HYPH|nr:hypothetical protein [Methylobacterium haplocladii]GEP01806.1 hypothetical protein MHA02_41930 [Methylobacterium haplocladii]GJD86203.1 hypothetical protein HPGCJGGD_4102 [Methylobacterium haplocladii]GLS60719.1 hypothetical protein GCM10007887_34040 [Methylobacterium haplocladii]